MWPASKTLVDYVQRRFIFVVLFFFVFFTVASCTEVMEPCSIQEAQLRQSFGCNNGLPSIQPVSEVATPQSFSYRNQSGHVLPKAVMAW